MLDDLYENIGGKIKGWAKWIFVVEAIAAVISGIVIVFSGEDHQKFLGVLMIFGGPVVAWVSSWILYALGQLVEDVHEIRNKEKTTICEVKPKQNIVEKDNSHKAIQCECGELHYERYCPVCGRKALASGTNNASSTKIVEDKPQTKSIVCKCGERFYGNTCPSCGRNIKEI